MSGVDYISLGRRWLSGVFLGGEKGRAGNAGNATFITASFPIRVDKNH